MKHWRPPKIEVFYKEHPDLLLMWNVLEIKEERSVPWYADEPCARSKKVELYGICRTNFNPEGNREHLITVAKAIGVDVLPIDNKQAYQKVLEKIETEACAS